MRAILIVAVSVLALTGCSNSVAIREAVGQGTRQLQGADLVLGSPLPIAAGKARVFLQDGIVSAGDGGFFSRSYDQYRPHCAFEIRQVSHNGFTIQPDTFSVIRVQGSMQQVVQRRPVQLAALRLAGGFDGGMGGGAYHEGYHFWLESDRQPEVMRMSCYGAYAQFPDLRPPTLQEVTQALGAVATLRY